MNSQIAWHCTSSLALLVILQNICLSQTFTHGKPASRCVVFCARSKSKDKEKQKDVGHAFVVLGKVTGNDSKTFCNADESWGFYPGDDQRATLLNVVPGKLEKEAISKDELPEDQCRLVVYVSEDRYDKAKAVVKKWKKHAAEETNAGKYQLLLNNCIDFQKEIAKTINLDTPLNVFKFPEKFLKELIELNASTPLP